jgi:hypothetical protein
MYKNDLEKMYKNNLEKNEEDYYETEELIHKKNRKKTFILDEKYITYDYDTLQKLKDILNETKINHKKEILKKNIKEAFVYCKINKLSGQITGPLIEYYIINKYNFKKNSSSKCCGDFNINNKNIEIKISLGGNEHDKFNYVQIRFNHNIDFFIFISYYLDKMNIYTYGELFVFKIKKQELKELVEEFGHYAHGTKKNLGKISIDNSNNHEYAIRPKYNDKCWKNLLKYRINNIEDI